jgi:DNA modification methylase
MKEIERNKIILGNALEVLKQFPDDCIDAIITDPPYQLDSVRKRGGKTDWSRERYKREELKRGGTVFTRQVRGFMQQTWDVLPSVGILKECLRVLKPGAFAFWMMTPRQDSQAEFVMRLKKAGFEVGFSPIYWTYAQGFCKAMNISKAVDKRECLKRLTERLGRKPSREEFNAEWKTFRVKIANNPNEHPNSNPQDNTLYQDGSTGRTAGITAPASEQAKALMGSFAGFQPKPAIELILVSMKALSEKTYIEQALKNRKGILWLDDCRIPVNPKINDMLKETKRKQRESEAWEKGSGFKNEANSLTGVRPGGRFPANLLVSNDVLNDGKILKGTGHFNSKVNMKGHTLYEGGFKNFTQEDRVLTDSGSFSSYFDLDAWFYDKVTDRIKELPKSMQATFPFLICPKANTSERNRGLNEGTGSNTYNRRCLKCGKWERDQAIYPGRYLCHCKVPEWETPKGNLHPTVKPIKLMSYLVMLGSREGDLVLDPFAGSGSTLIACKLLKRDYIGIEINEEYYKIALKRLEAWKNE